MLERIDDAHTGELERRLGLLAHRWGVEIIRRRIGPIAIVGFGVRDGRDVVLKVAAAHGDEWRGGGMLRALGADVTPAILARDEGAVLMERIIPGTPLTALVRAGHDDEATVELARLIGRMRPSPPPRDTPTVRDQARGFERYRRSGDTSIEPALIDAAARVVDELLADGSPVRLLHGDLHHDNVLLDERRGPLAIDPKGVVGEPEYELAAALRNPIGLPEVWCSRAAVERRLSLVAEHLPIDVERARRWAFAGAVLSAVWSAEDGEEVAEEMPVLRLARALWEDCD